MRNRSPFAALIAAAALIVTAVPAYAAPATPATPSAPTSAVQESAAEQIRSLVEALRADLGLTPEQFLAQATVGDRLSRAQNDWAQNFADSFAGVWLNDKGTGLVGVAPGKQAAKLRAQATKAGFTVKDVALTKDQLAARQQQVTQILATAPDDLKALVTGVTVDPARNTVVVATRGGTAAQLGNLTSLLKDLAVLDMTDAPDPRSDLAPLGSSGGSPNPLGSPGTDSQKGAEAQTGTGPQPTASSQPGSGSLTALKDSGILPEGPLSTIIDMLATLTPGTGSIIDGMNREVPNPEQPVPADRTRTYLPVPTGPVVGGTAYETPVDGGVLECSTGFNGELDGKPVVITAAHCAGKEGNRVSFPDGGEFGTMTALKKDSIDSALIAVDSDKANRFTSNLVGTGASTTTPITGTASPVVGQKACKMGSRTGYSCGTISETGALIDVAGKRSINNGFTVDLCALPGDSGGVVFSGDKALGVSSASNVADTGTCAQASVVAAANGFTPRLSAVPITDVLAAHPGLKLRAS